jgi:hypothetical protein
MKQSQEHTASSIAKDLYRRACSLHDLRVSYVDDSEHGIGTGDGKRLDNPFLSLTRHELDEATRWWPPDYETEHYQLDSARQLLDRAELDAKKDLIDEKVVALGYTSPSDQSPRLVPSTHWHFLTVDFDEDTAEGFNLYYAGLRFVQRDTLTTAELESVTAPTTSETQNGAFKTAGYEWTDLTLRFVKNDMVEVTLGEQERKYALGKFGLLNKTTGEPNYAAMYLIRLATRSSLSKGKGVKDAMRDIRKVLGRIVPGLDGDPIPNQGTNGYVPQFKVIDACDALDKRAKERTPHDEYIDDSPHSIRTDDYSFDSEDDRAGRFIQGQP